MSDWVDPDSHGWVLHPRETADWQALIDEYGGSHPRPFERVLEVARENGCKTVVVENRYVDLDYRSEYSAFWSLRFQSPPAFGRRLHFFSAHLDDETMHRLPDEAGYLGYSVLRPVESGRVGRTMLMPPLSLRGATLSLVRDEVSLFGNDLEVEGVPFCQQDGEYLRCAHVAAWTCHYTAHRRGLVGRQTTAQIAQTSPSMLSWERPLPSKGMTLNQLQAVFGSLGQPAIFYPVSRLPTVAGVEAPDPVKDAAGNVIPPGNWDTRIFSVICRYLNSRFPVLIGSEDHAFVLAGWMRDGEHVRFIACDDQVGPYEVIETPFEHYKAPWLSIMISLPPKVFLSGESAETAAHKRLTAIAQRGWPQLAQGLADGSVQLRSSLRTGRVFKRDVEAQASSDAVLRRVRLARLPHWVWVIEAHTTAACRDGENHLQRSANRVVRCDAGAPPERGLELAGRVDMDRTEVSGTPAVRDRDRHMAARHFRRISSGGNDRRSAFATPGHGPRRRSTVSW